MKLRDALGAELRSEMKADLSALKKDDRKKVSAPQSVRISGSVDLDECMRRKDPHANRWDYVIAKSVNPSDDELFYVEVHPAKSEEVSAMIKKRQWLEDWINSGQTRLDRMKTRSTFTWIASGRILIQKNSSQDRLIRKHRLFPVSRLVIE